MRFEIKTGGLTAILLSLTALSGVVFVMGLRAGYDIALQSQPAPDKVATDYPLTPPPAPAAAQTITDEAPAAGASIAPATPAQPPPAPPPSKPELVANPPSGAVARPKPPNASPPPQTDEGSASEASDQDSNEPPDEPPSPAARVAHKPYNIEIQAAMDSTSASQMVRRLESLGYQPHLAPTELNGTTWYKVEVGPYASQDEAAAAEVALRQKYNATYGHGGAPAQPAPAGPVEGADE